MAITCALPLHTYGSLALPAAYVKVATAEAYKALVRTNPPLEPEPQLEEQQMVRYSADVYLDAAARAGRRNPLDRVAAAFPWDPGQAPNILSACYADLKAQDAYAAATDC